jgi:hypothetical protein
MAGGLGVAGDAVEGAGGDRGDDAEAGGTHAPVVEASGGGAEDGPTGLAAFPPLGTKPLLRGLEVPDGYVLPPGYVRHYQGTDDGRLLPPILRFHPDYQPVDADGRPIPLPADRVVPPELAPPGLPLAPGEGGR